MPLHCAYNVRAGEFTRALLAVAQSRRRELDAVALCSSLSIQERSAFLVPGVDLNLQCDCEIHLPGPMLNNSCRVEERWWPVVSPSSFSADFVTRGDVVPANR